MKIAIIVLVPVNVLYINHIMRATLFLECTSISNRFIYSIYLNSTCGFTLPVRYRALLNCESLLLLLLFIIIINSFYIARLYSARM